MNAVRKEETVMESQGQDMLDRSSSWTLACDNSLLNRLKKFSEDLTRTSEDILKECDSLSRSVTQLDYRLINVSNEFHMLANTQFVENRVEDFEEYSSYNSSNTVTTIHKTKAEKEAALISKMKEAIQLGLSACHDGRKGNEAVINRYKLKQPYLIGSPKFFSSKYCGLVDETSRQAPIFHHDPIDMDSVSIDQDFVPASAAVSHEKPEVKFTMPPTPVFPYKIPDVDRQTIASDNQQIRNEERAVYGSGRHVPPSPTVSSRSSEIGGSASSVSTSRDNTMPRSVTDELNKIYGSFAPPATADDESDDDFRPSAGVGRIFEEDDDDIFGEKELFPSSQKNTDFFGRSNPNQLPAPVFSVPPPINPVPVPQSKPTMTVSDVQTIVGPKPKVNDIPSTNSVTGDIPKKDVLIREPPPEAEGSYRTKLPPGAVSMFGGLAPPVFNNGTLQAAPTASKDSSSFVSKPKPDTQISSNSSAEVGNGLAPAFDRDNAVVSSLKRENVNQKSVSSQPNLATAAPGRTENISRGSLSSGGDVSRKAKPTQAVPVSSLFADDSSDEDIFQSSKRQEKFHPKNVGQNKKLNPNPTNGIFSNNTSSSTEKASLKKKVVKEKIPVKKSIFDESDSDDDLFSSRPSIVRPEKSKVATTNNLFTNKVDTKKNPVQIKVNKNKSLFGDDSDSDTDLFGNKKKVVVKHSALSVPPKVLSKMEDTKAESVWDDNDLFDTPSTQQLNPKQDPQDREDTSEKSTVSINNNNNLITEDPVENKKQVIQSSSSDSIISKNVGIAQGESKERETKRSIKKSIFDDSESDDDDLFSSKPKPVPNIGFSKSESATLLSQKRPVLSSNIEKGKRSSLFGDESDSDSDLFGSKTKNQGTKKSTSLGNIQSDKELSNSDSREEKENIPSKKQESNPHNNSDVVDATSLPSTEPEEEISTTSAKDDKKEDELKSSKVLGSKISAKIKAMQVIKTENEKSKSETEGGIDSLGKKNIKPKVSVKSLALNLNINPLALKVGAKPPKLGGSTPNTPEKEAKEAEPPAINDTSKLESLDKLNSKEIVKNKKPENKEESDSYISKNVEDDEPKPIEEKHLGVNELVGILKARVKIQKKRRPPSRNFLKSLAVSEEKTEDTANENLTAGGDLESKDTELEETLAEPGPHINNGQESEKEHEPEELI